MSELADLEVIAVDDVWVACLSGEIDLSNAEAIATAIEPVFERQGKGLVIDLTAVEYLDSAGIRLIFRMVRSSESRGWRLRLVVPAQSHLRRVLDLADVARAVQLEETRAGAVTDIKAASDEP